MKQGVVSSIGSTTVDNEVNLAASAGFNDFVMESNGDLTNKANGKVYPKDTISRMFFVPCDDGGGVYYIATNDGGLGLLLETTN